uniref:Putative secreted protein n=1 Tax=Panstrongylus lignarius TaxID=156445 RepID=A0A224Y1Y7_9HEMI
MQANLAVLVISGLSSACANLLVLILRGHESALSWVRNTAPPLALSELFPFPELLLPLPDNPLSFPALLLPRTACFNFSRTIFTFSKFLIRKHL